MRFLGIDYGSKNIGVSLSDERGEWAFPHSVLENNKKAVGEILKIVKENKVKDVVIGESRNFKGNENTINAAAKDFAKSLAAISHNASNIHFELEYLTSHQAQHIQGVNKMLDASAATIILQSFLDKRKNKVE